MTRHRTVFLDLDDTLYPSSSGVWQAIGGRINAFLQERLGISPDQVAAVRDRYFRLYGTTLNGLIVHYHIDPKDYLSYVHDLPLEDKLHPDPDLRKMLESLPQKRVILTNASREHADRVLNQLGIREVIDQVIDILALELHNKPEPEAYIRAMALTGERDPEACLAADDSLLNLRTARELGMTTVLVGKEDEDGVAHYRIPRVSDLIRAVPGLIGDPPAEEDHE